MTETSRRRLTKRDWTGAALAALAAQGLSGVAIEPLAATLGATKGSGYWHFANRAALVRETLARWEEQTAEIIASLEQGGTAYERLRRLLYGAVGSVDQNAVELALLAHADDPDVADVLARVSERRLDYITGLFVQLGCRPKEARRRAVFSYTTYLGHAQLARSAPGAAPAPKAYLDLLLRGITVDLQP